MKNKFFYILMAILAIAIGIYPSIYFIIQSQFGLLTSKSAALLADPFWKAAFYTHITIGGIALLTGWIQFNEKIRKTRPRIHRQLGKIYVTAVMISSIAAVYISFFSTGGWITATGFGLLGVVWFSSTLIAYLHVRRQKFDEHRQAMVFSYAACFAAVTLRVYLPLLQIVSGDFLIAYKIVSWLCWVPNLVVAYFIARKMGEKPVQLLSKYSVSKESTDMPMIN